MCPTTCCCCVGGGVASCSSLRGRFAGRVTVSPMTSADTTSCDGGVGRLGETRRCGLYTKSVGDVGVRRPCASFMPGPEVVVEGPASARGVSSGCASASAEIGGAGGEETRLRLRVRWVGFFVVGSFLLDDFGCTMFSEGDSDSANIYVSPKRLEGRRSHTSHGGPGVRSLVFIILLRISNREACLDCQG